MRSGGVPRLDPAYVILLIAAVTERLGFVVTSSVTYDHPVSLARKFTTLDHLTDGRIGWNVVATNVRSAALNHGLAEQLLHDTRYDRGDEFLDVAYALWTEAWDDGAVGARPLAGPLRRPGEGACDRAPRGVVRRQRRADRRALAAAGAGPLPGRPSDRGRQFAATHAECVYLNTQSAARRRRTSSPTSAAAPARSAAATRT